MGADGSKRATRRNGRAVITDAERATIDALDEAAFSPSPLPAGADALADLRAALAKQTAEALRTAIPDLDERARAQSVEWEGRLEALKGTGWPIVPRPPALSDIVTVPALDLSDLFGPHPSPVFMQQPPNVGELWWAESAWGYQAPSELFIDIDNDPYRIWGHIRYNHDDLFTGHVAIVMTFILSPDRMWRTRSTTFEVRPELRVGGWVSGWTDQYHPIWHADDKWSKCWHFLGASLALSDGGGLAGDALSQNLFFLENVNPVGQASINEFFGWTPVLRFSADMADLRRRGVSIILRTELRFDFQLEGGSDLWFRNRPGSMSESVPAFDNAVTFRCWPGVVKPA